MAFFETAALTFIVILLAEIGDKTQFVLIGLAVRGHRIALFAGTAVAFLLLVVIAVVAADVVARIIPALFLGLLGGLVFLAFGVHFLRERPLPVALEDAAPVDAATGARAAFVTTFGLIFVAELGDKSQLAVLALAAARGEPVAVALGAWTAQLISAVVALAIGTALAGLLSARSMRVLSGVVFLVVGNILIVGGMHDATAVACCP